MSIIRQDYGAIGTDIQTQMLIAPVLAEMKADRQFAVGDQFIVDSVLYKITTAISVIGTPLVVGTNCEVSDTISQQIENLKDDTVGTILSVNSSTVSAYGSTLSPVVICTLTLPKGKWDVSGYVSLSMSESNKIYISRIETSGGTPIVPTNRSIGTNGGGVTMSAPFNSTRDNTVINLLGWTDPSFETTCKFIGYFKAIKISS